MSFLKRLLRLVYLTFLGLWSLTAYPQSESSSPVSQKSTAVEQTKVAEDRDVQLLRDLLGSAQTQPEFLDPEVAYRIDLQNRDPNTLVALFTIEDGYYLYQNKFEFSSQTEGVSIGDLSLPEGKKKTDSYFGEQIVYYNGFEVEVPLVRALPEVDEVVIKVNYQGCAEQGICYPPMDKVFTLNLPGIDDAQAAITTDPGNPETLVGIKAVGPAADAGAGSGILWAVLFAFVAGLALTFTPCVLPMIPILASIVVGQGGSRTKLQSGLLSIMFVLGTAVTYTAVGVVAGATGNQLQAYFQNPWGIGVVVVILMGLSLSMFGLYDIQLPASFQSKLQSRASHLKGGALGGVFAMGLISALIVGACVSPVLIAVLGLAIERADPVLGGMIMFSMALGSGVVLVGLGFGAAFLMPKMGPWMNNVKYVFGVMLLGVAVYILGALPEVPVLYLWGILFILSSIYLGALQSLPADTNGWRYLQKGIGVLALVWGVLALLGGMTGNRDITRPIDLSGKFFFGAPPSGKTLDNEISGSLFTRVSDMATLDTRITQAKAAGRPIMLDYWAEWCMDCIRMENNTFSNPEVRQALSNFVMLQIDVTDPRNSDTNALKTRFGVYGPPAMLFFDKAGEERKELRRYGYMNANEFLAHINQI
jgi:thiol:disulfide interchange protein DsbD